MPSANTEVPLDCDAVRRGHWAISHRVFTDPLGHHLRRNADHLGKVRRSVGILDSGSNCSEGLGIHSAHAASIKHCFLQIKHCCLIESNDLMTRMKSTNDTTELARRVKQAIDDSGMTSAQIAAACGVSPQAVNGWKKTGRIGKEQLPKLAQLTGRPLDWWLSGEPTNASPQSAATERLLFAVRGRSAEEIERIAEALEILLRAGRDPKGTASAIEIDVGDDASPPPGKQRAG
jgi:transcriptional regulator with XRE-family HTH domain